jgi:hypothetical protein
MEERNILHKIKRRKANWIGYIFHRKCLLQHITEEKTGRGIEVTGIEGRRCKQLLHELKDTKNQDALDRSVWRILFGRG